MKLMRSHEELIDHMKEKGIRFNIVNEEEALSFLENNNYYMKLSSYRKNYDLCNSGKRAGQYQNLEFAYLKELSTIDMHLRYMIMQMCLDIEHAIKVRLIKDCTDNPEEDGYKIVREYLATEDHNFSLLKSINSMKSGEYCKDLINGYYPFFPIWVLVEVIPFGTLLHICHFYEKKYSRSVLLEIEDKFMNTVRDFRNACAHNNCLLNQMCKPLDSTKQPDSRITTFIKERGKDKLSRTVRTKYLGMSFPYNIVTLLYVYDLLINDNAKQHRYADIKGFLHERVIRHRDYFTSNQRLCGVYHFFEKLLDNFCSLIVT